MNDMFPDEFEKSTDLRNQIRDCSVGRITCIFNIISLV